MRRRYSLALIYSMFACLASVAPLLAQDDVDFGVQVSDGKLIVGRAGPDVPIPTYPISVLTRNFLANNLGIEPGFFTYGAGSPAFSLTALDGIDPLPPSTALEWDFLPMTVDSMESNLLYWDGLDDTMDGIDSNDVEFIPSTGVEFTLNSTNGNGGGQASVTGTDEFVTGSTITTTSSSGALLPGSIHHHPLFQLSSTTAAPVPQGVYVVSLQARMEGFEESDPFFMALRTFTIDGDAETAAEAWIIENLDMLLGEEPLLGDYNGDGDVENGDFLTWQEQFGSTVSEAGDGADGSFDGLVDGIDYAIWRENLPISAAAASTPEPASAGLIALACLAGCRFRQRLR